MPLLATFGAGSKEALAEAEKVIYDVDYLVVAGGGGGGAGQAAEQVALDYIHRFFYYRIRGR